MAESSTVCARCLKPRPQYAWHYRSWTQAYGHLNRKSLWLCGLHGNTSQDEIERLLQNPIPERAFQCSGCGKQLRVRAWVSHQFLTEARRQGWKFFGPQGWRCLACPQRPAPLVAPLPCEVHRESNLVSCTEEIIPAWVFDFQSVMEAFLKIPFRLRLSLKYRFYDGLTYKEVGECLNVSKGRAEQIVNEAIWMVRRNMRPHV